MKIIGYFVPRNDTYVFDVLLDEEIIRGSRSYPATYPAICLLLGAAHIISGVTRAIIPSGGILQSFRLDIGSVIFGVLILFLGIKARAKSVFASHAHKAVLVSKFAFALLFLDGILSLAAFLYVGFTHSHPELFSEGRAPLASLCSAIILIIYLPMVRFSKIKIQKEI